MLQKDNTYTKLFVGGLPYHTTNESLNKYFLEFGEIEEAVVIHDRVTKKSKGYGFVSLHRQYSIHCINAICHYAHTGHNEGQRGGREGLCRPQSIYRWQKGQCQLSISWC